MIRILITSLLLWLVPVAVAHAQGEPPAPAPKSPDAKAPADPPPEEGAETPEAPPPDGGDEPPLMGDEPPPPPPPPAPAPKTAAGDDEARPDGAQKKEAVSPERNLAEHAQPTSEVYAEDWWRLSRPVFEIHGYYRVRSEFFHNFALGRVDQFDGVRGRPMWPQPPDHSYVDTGGGGNNVQLCGDDPDSLEACDNNTQAGANMRFRLNPELHISDNVRVRAQIDLLDNIVLGSTPQGYANVPGPGGEYAVVSRGGYAPLGAFSSTQWAPVAGVNSTRDSITVKRVWGEYSSPIGQLRFGRMPSHWGLGMLVNAGDEHDSDWQSTADRLMFITGVRSWDLYFAAAWDFANEGPTSATFSEQEGQPYDLAQTDDLDQWVFVVMRRVNDDVARKLLDDGHPIFEGGAYVVYRQQEIANESRDPANAASLGQQTGQVAQGYMRRNAQAVIPDGWFRFRYDEFRLEVESALIWGSIENTAPNVGESNFSADPNNPDETGWNIRQWGLAAETSYRALDDKLRLSLKFGYATGDDDVEGLAPIGEGLQPNLTPNRTFSTFRFHPDYRVDLILFRNILTRVQGAYYFRPGVGYDFVRDPDGQKIGGDAALIWSRASEFMQTPGNARDLGIELNFKLHYQAKDGVLNDDPDRMGGFYTSLEYGVLFPLDGLGYLPQEVVNYANDYQSGDDEPIDTETAQTVRWYLGILF